LSDKGFSKEHGWSLGDTGRTGRYAMIVEKDGTISYAENESNPVEVTVSQHTISDNVRSATLIII